MLCDLEQTEQCTVHRPLLCYVSLSRQSNGMVTVQNIKLVEKVDQMAKAKGVESGQLALAWVHSQVQQGTGPQQNVSTQLYILSFAQK